MQGGVRGSGAAASDLSWQTIRAVQPDVVVVELCQYRVSMLKMDERTLLREAKEISLEKLQQAVRQVRGPQGTGASLLCPPVGLGPRSQDPRETRPPVSTGSSPPCLSCRGPFAPSLTGCQTKEEEWGTQQVRAGVGGGGLSPVPPSASPKPSATAPTVGSGVLDWAGGKERPGQGPADRPRAALGGPARPGRAPWAGSGCGLSTERSHVGADADAAAEGVGPHHGAAGHGARRRVPRGLQGGGPGSGAGGRGWLGTGPGAGSIPSQPPPLPRPARCPSASSTSETGPFPSPSRGPSPRCPSGRR